MSSVWLSAASSVALEYMQVPNTCRSYNFKPSIRCPDLKAVNLRQNLASESAVLYLT